MSGLLAWVVAHPYVMVVGVLMCAVAVAVIMVRARGKEIEQLEDELGVSDARGKVAQLEGARKVLKKKEAMLGNRDRVLAAEDNKLIHKIRDVQKEAVAARESVEGKNAAEIAARFNDLFK